MPLSDELRKANQDLWERMVTHPFVQELGDGTLPREKYQRYFLQDYLFVGTLAKVVGLAVVKAPSLEAAQPLSPFLNTLLNAENALFTRVFQDLDIPPEQYHAAQLLPTMQAMAGFMLSTAYDGTFDDIVTALLVDSSSSTGESSIVSSSADSSVSPVANSRMSSRASTASTELKPRKSA